ncbi:putative polysaccharide biosynthesis protein [Anaerobacillus alkaliphilus]|nr:polysaccharide biosynthesis protein [Anaerobacillus alkaliphilus]
MSKTFVKGAIILTIATFLSKLLGSVFRIPLQNIAGNEVLGIFTLVYPVYMAVLIISVAGIPIAISKLISEARVKNSDEDIRNIFVTSGIITFLLGSLSFLLMFTFSETIALVLGGPYATYSVMIVSITLIFAPYMAVYRGFFQGYGDMKPTAYSQVLEQFVRVALILVIAYILVVRGAASDVVAGGVMVGSSIGVLASLVFLRWTFNRSGLKPASEKKYNWAVFKAWSKKILWLSIPICIGALTMALLNLVDSVTIPVQLRNAGFVNLEVADQYGIYSRGLTLVQIVVVFASALILPLIPYVTEALAKNDILRTKTVVEKALKFTHLTSWPAAIGLMALTLPVNLALFKDLEGSLVIAIISFSALFTSLAVLTTGVLQGMNRSNEAAIIVIISAAVKIVLNIVLVGAYGLVGAAISTLITYVVLTALNYWMINKTVPFSIVNRATIVFAVSSIFMGTAIALPLTIFTIEEWTRVTALLYTAVSIAVGGSIYGVLVLLLRALTKDELATFPIVGNFLAKSLYKTMKG